MRDIYHSSTQAHTHLATHLSSPVRSSRLQTILHAFNRWGGAVVGLMEGKSSTTESIHLAPTVRQRLTRLPLAQTAGHRIRNGSRIVFEKGMNSAQNTKRRLKTPAGKVAAVNMVALLALFVYVQFQAKPAPAQATRDVGAAVNASVQRYLPVVGSTNSVKAFQESSVTQNTHHTPLYVWVTPWNIAQITSNKATYSSFSAFWATVNSDGASISLKNSLDAWQTFAKNVTQPTYLTVSGDPNYTYQTLSSPTTQQNFITNSLALLNQYNFTGLDIDFEGLGSANRDLFTEFARNLATALHAENKQLAVTLEARIANDVPMDWHNLGLIADEVRIMAYDYHSQTTDQPGPIAPLGWVKEVADYATQNIDPHKIVIGLGNYGYDWIAPTDTNPSWAGTGVSFEQAQALSQQYKVPILQSSGIDSRGYDIGTAPNFVYQDSQGTQHAVWFEDSNSLQEKVDLLNQYPFKGVIFWSVGLGDQTFWSQQQN